MSSYCISKLMPEQVWTFYQFTWRKKSVGNVFKEDIYFSTTILLHGIKNGLFCLFVCFTWQDIVPNANWTFCCSCCCGSRSCRGRNVLTQVKNNHILKRIKTSKLCNCSEKTILDTFDFNKFARDLLCKFGYIYI